LLLVKFFKLQDWIFLKSIFIADKSASYKEKM